jgi:autotransporter-associated beta strand protein
VRQSAAVANAQTVTLSPGTGESFTLGSAVTDTGGNTNSLLKSGDGTTTLITSNTFTGATTVSDGTLNVGAAGALGSTASLAVNTGGTLLLSGTGDRINDTAGLTLAGGTFNTAGNSETVGALTLSGSSIIDMGSVASLLTFTSVGHTAWSGTLSIWNWNGSWTGGGSDQLLFLSNANNGNVNLSNVQFYSDSGFTPIGFGAGFVSGGTELVPVPEPSGIFVGLAMLGIAGWRERRRAKLAGRADRHTPSLPVSIPVLTVSGAPGAKANS